MKKFVRQLKPGQEFTLLRTGERFKFLRREHVTPSGTRHVCINLSDIPVDQNKVRESNLHHSCHVMVHEEPQ